MEQFLFFLNTKLPTLLNDKLFENEKMKPKITEDKAKKPKITEDKAKKINYKIDFSNLIERFFFYLFCFIIFIIIFVLILGKMIVQKDNNTIYSVPQFHNLNNFGIIFSSLFSIFVLLCLYFDLINGKEIFKLPFKNIIERLYLIDYINSIFFLPLFFIVFSILLIFIILYFINYYVAPTALIIFVIYLNFFHFLLHFYQNEDYLSIWKILTIPFICILISCLLTTYNIFLHNTQIKNCKNLDLSYFKDFFVNINLFNKIFICFIILLFVFLPIILFHCFQLTRFDCGKNECDWFNSTILIYIIFLAFYGLSSYLIYQSIYIETRLNSYIGYWKCNE
jgi:hypothetical protein